MVYEPVTENGVHWEGAICQQFPNADEIWFPEKGFDNRLAKRLCGMCPVRAPCLEYALEMEDHPKGHTSGVFGGLSPHERDALRAARKGAA